MVAGSPGRPVRVPAGTRRRSAGKSGHATARDQREAGQDRAGTGREAEAGQQHSRPGRGEQAVGQTVFPRLSRRGRPEPDQRGHGDGSGHRDHGQQAQEHPAPSEQVRHLGADRRADQPGGDPCRRTGPPSSVRAAYREGSGRWWRRPPRAPHQRRGPAGPGPRPARPSTEQGPPRPARSRTARPPATNGTAGPRRSASRPAATIPTTLPSMNPLNTQPYRRRPPRSRATTGMTVTTASASDATKVIVRTRPVVSARRCGAHKPGTRPSPPGPIGSPLRPAAPPSLSAVRPG